MHGLHHPVGNHARTHRPIWPAAWTWCPSRSASGSRRSPTMSWTRPTKLTARMTLRMSDAQWVQDNRTLHALLDGTPTRSGAGGQRRPASIRASACRLTVGGHGRVLAAAWPPASIRTSCCGWIGGCAGRHQQRVV